VGDARSAYLPEQRRFADASAREDTETLPLAYRQQRIEHAHTGNERRVHRTPAERGRRVGVEGKPLLGVNDAAVERAPERVDHLAGQIVTPPQYRFVAHPPHAGPWSYARQRAQRHRQQMAVSKSDDLKLELVALRQPHSQSVADPRRNPSDLREQ